VISLLERDGVKTFVVDTTAERSAFRSWPVPSLTVVRGTTIGAEDVPPFGLPRVTVQPDGTFVPIPKEEWAVLRIEDQVDALLYLGPESTRRMIEWSPGMCDDREYIEAHLKRMELGGAPASERDRVRTFCAVAK